jgi:hypothetical protein
VIKRINYTGRIRILREDVRIYVTQEAGSPAVFRAELRLDDYGLPPDAAIRIEAYRGTTWAGFNLGTVGAPDLLGDHPLTEFGEPDGVRFRVRIVSADPHRPVVLAAAEHLSGLAPGDEPDGREPLLPVVGEDLDSELWRLETDSAPLLKVNNKVPNWRALATHPIFLGLVYPNVLRTMLREAVRQKADPDDPDSFHAKWLRFAQALPNVDPFDPHGDTEDWIESAVSSFAGAQNVLTRFVASWKEN